MSSLRDYSTEKGKASSAGIELFRSRRRDTLPQDTCAFKSEQFFGSKMLFFHGSWRFCVCYRATVK